MTAIACVVLTPAPSLADGEHRAALKGAFIEGYQKRIQDMGHAPFTPEQADRFAECVVSHAMRDVTADEEKELDSWATGGPEPDKGLLNRIQQGLVEAGFLGVCSPL